MRVGPYCRVLLLELARNWACVRVRSPDRLGPSGVAVLVLMAFVPATLLILHGWASRIGFGLWLNKKPFRVLRKVSSGQAVVCPRTYHPCTRALTLSTTSSERAKLEAILSRSSVRRLYYLASSTFHRGWPDLNARPLRFSWLAPLLLRWCLLCSQRYIQLREMGGGQDQDDPEGAVGVHGDNPSVASRIFPVTASRAPVRELLILEHDYALREEVDRVKASFWCGFGAFLVSGYYTSRAAGSKNRNNECRFSRKGSILVGAKTTPIDTTHSSAYM